VISCTFEDGGNASLRHVTIDAIVADNGKILLVKRAANLSNGGKYAVPGGFLGRDENTKNAVEREVLEETGYRIKIEALFTITDKPDRKNEDRQNVNFTFLAKALDKDQAPDNEVSEVVWISLDNLPPEGEFAFDHYERVKLYKKYIVEKFPLPLVES
jgi:ADP-ribose pyrophosphatase YjhB (NUDIX family)